MCSAKDPEDRFAQDSNSEAKEWSATHVLRSEGDGVQRELWRCVDGVTGSTFCACSEPQRTLVYDSGRARLHQSELHHARQSHSRCLVALRRESTRVST